MTIKNDGIPCSATSVKTFTSFGKCELAIQLAFAGTPIVVRFDS